MVPTTRSWSSAPSIEPGIGRRGLGAIRGFFLLLSQPSGVPMSSLRLRASLALVLAAFTAACGDSGSTGPSFADSASTAEAIDFADGAASTASYLAENLNFGMPSVGLSSAMATRVMNRPEVVAAQSRMRWVRPISLARLDMRALTRPEGLQAAADGCTITARGTWDPPYEIGRAHV